ncbi:MAG TPA: hypothetical protein RMH99_30305 [Sandaracinaceae bacterium LLY-WYZ-13_1]|nr:hypothetical protein [Sandaracinaceae bacterium LLY-WYZ-13_1]
MSHLKLDVLNVKSPCPESWDAMSGDGEARFCGVCRMNVYDLSAMTRERAEALLTEREGRLCVRFYRRADGTVTTADCAPMRFAAMRRAARQTLTAAAALLVSLISIVAGLGLFRLAGADVSSWLEHTAVGQVAKMGGLVEPQPTMGEPVPLEYEMGERVEPAPGDGVEASTDDAE